MKEVDGAAARYGAGIKIIERAAAKFGICAELDVMHQSKLRASVDLEARAVFEQEFRRERERLTTERDAKVEKARRS